MTDREKVIEALEEIAEYFRECRSNASFGSKAEIHFWALQSAAQAAVGLLKEKPVIIEGNTLIHIGQCPECKTVLNPWGAKFCWKCGQAVKWDG